MKSVKSISLKRLLKPFSSLLGVAAVGVVSSLPAAAFAPVPASTVRAADWNTQSTLSIRDAMLIACGCGNRGGNNSSNSNAGTSSRSVNSGHDNYGGWYGGTRSSLACANGIDGTAVNPIADPAILRRNCRNLNSAASSTPTETPPAATEAPPVTPPPPPEPAPRAVPQPVTPPPAPSPAPQPTPPSRPIRGLW